MEVTIQSSLEQFNAAFTRYMDYTRKTPDEALERKAKNIGIKLYRSFTDREYGGAPKQIGLALADLESRTAEGRGTKIRDSLMQQYEDQRADLVKERGNLRRQKKKFGGTLDDFTSLQSALQDNANKRFSLWQDIVGQEVKKRQQGIGYLGASFLAMRKRSNNAEGIFYVVNNAGRGIGYVLKEPGLLRISSLADGSGLIDLQYGLVAQAIADESEDMIEFMDSKDADNRAKAGLN